MVRSCFVPAVLCFLLGLVPAAAGKGVLRMPVVIPGGVADAGGKTGYVANPTGGIDAIDLQSGKLLWATEEASRPLVAFGHRLVAQAGRKGRANSVRVVVLDGKDRGKRLLASDPVVFP